MDINRALSLAATAGPTELRQMYAAAVARGAGNTGRTAEEERACGTARLVALALMRAADLALSAHLLDLVDEDEEDALVARAARDVSAGALRLATRALEVHGRQVGYRTDAWIDGALLYAGTRLDWQATADNHGLPVALDEARSATAAIARAGEATGSDWMLLPEQLAAGLGICWRSTRSHGRRGDDRVAAQPLERLTSRARQTAAPVPGDRQRGRVPPGVRRRRPESRHGRERTAARAHGE